MLVSCVHDVCLSISDPFTCTVRKPEKVHQSVMLMMCFFMTLSIAFITSDVCKSLGHSELFLGMGTNVECFHSWETVPFSTHP